VYLYGLIIHVILCYLRVTNWRNIDSRTFS